MNARKASLIVLLLALPACGAQVVEFPNGDAGNSDAAHPDGSGGHAGIGGGGGLGGRGGSGGGGLGGAGQGGASGGAGHLGGAGQGGASGSAGHLGGAGQGGASSSAGGTAGHSVPDGGSCSQAPVALGAAAGFAVLAGPTVTNTGLTTVTGDLGTSPGTAVTGFGPGVVVGTQHAGDGVSASAQASLTTAYNDAAGRSLCPVSVAGNLGGLTLAPGLYKSTSSLEISSGDLVLDAHGDPNAVFIFQMATTLATTSGRQVMLTGGALAANVFWQVGSSATLGTTSVFAGTIMADQSISLSTGATLNGRALARIAGVTLDTNVIVKP